MATNYLTFYSQFQSLIDSINHDSDVGKKLFNLQSLQKDGLKLIIKSRDEAAYELRSRYSGPDAERITGISRKYIDYWARRWMKKNSLPRLKNRLSVDLSDVIDLSHRFNRPSKGI